MEFLENGYFMHLKILKTKFVEQSLLIFDMLCLLKSLILNKW